MAKVERMPHRSTSTALPPQLQSPIHPPPRRAAAAPDSTAGSLASVPHADQNNRSLLVRPSVLLWPPCVLAGGTPVLQLNQRIVDSTTNHIVCCDSATGGWRHHRGGRFIFESTAGPRRRVAWWQGVNASWRPPMRSHRGLEKAEPEAARNRAPVTHAAPWSNTLTSR